MDISKIIEIGHNTHNALLATNEVITSAFGKNAEGALLQNECWGEIVYLARGEGENFNVHIVGCGDSLTFEIEQDCGGIDCGTLAYQGAHPLRSIWSVKDAVRIDDDEGFSIPAGSLAILATTDDRDVYKVFVLDRAYVTYEF